MEGNVEHNGIDCLHVMIETDNSEVGIAHAHIPLDDIQRSANIYNGMNKIEGDPGIIEIPKEQE